MEKYKLLLVVPVILLLISAGILLNNHNQTGDFFKKSIELRGGNQIIIETEKIVDVETLEISLSQKLGEVSISELRGLTGYKLSIETESKDIDLILAELENNGIETDKYSVRNIGARLAGSFWSQIQLGIIVAFILMGVIVFFIFRSFVPSIAVMFAAVSDIVVTLALMQVFGIELSLASFAAILMLIGYSIDTDILLTTRFLKDEGTMSEKFRPALKTGLTMTITTIGALSALLLSAVSPVLSQIASVLVIGLAIDIINTWLMNAGILRWHAVRKGLA